jgi:hypothetical protein
MILETTGFTRKSALKIIGRDTKMSPDRQKIEDWLLVDFNGKTCKVGVGFFGVVDLDFKMPERAIIMHMVVDERSENEYLRFPVFLGFYYE